MRRAVVCLILGLACVADDGSGPGRHTLQKTPWGSLFLERAALGTHRVVPSNGDLRVQSSQGDVLISGGPGGDFRLRCGSDQLTVRSGLGSLDVRWGARSWSLRQQEGRLTLEASEPRDRVVFERDGEAFTIKGARGFLDVRRGPGTLRLRSSAGEATFVSALEGDTATGIPPEGMPYLGRGIFLTFHGVGLFLDVQTYFPMPEVSAWSEWRPLLETASR